LLGSYINPQRLRIYPYTHDSNPNRQQQSTSIPSSFIDWTPEISAQSSPKSPSDSTPCEPSPSSNSNSQPPRKQLSNLAPSPDSEVHLFLPKLQHKPMAPSKQSASPGASHPNPFESNSSSPHSSTTKTRNLPIQISSKENASTGPMSTSLTPFSSAKGTKSSSSNSSHKTQKNAKPYEADNVVPTCEPPTFVGSR
jgi:hypothetical protein